MNKLTFIFQIGLAILLAMGGAWGQSPQAPSHIPSVPEKWESKAHYEAFRAELKAKDSLLAFDAATVLTPAEQQLDTKLQALRRDMTAQYRQRSFFPPAEYYYKSAEHIHQTKLFALLKQMPKGGILHLHGAAAGDFRWIVERALREPNCYVYWDNDRDGFLKGQLRFFAKGQAPKGFQLVAEVAKRDKQFANKLYDLLTLDARSAHDSTDVWVEFEGTFKKIGGFLRYQPVFEDYYRHVVDVLAEDQVQHVELREGLSGALYDLKPNSRYTPDSLVAGYERVRQYAAQKYPGFTQLLIYSNVRFMDVEAQRKDLLHAFEMRKKYPEAIVGYDLVAEEDKGNATSYYLDNWLDMDSLRQVYGVDLPLYLHDGESNWPEVDNLYDATLLRSRRFGHGYNLFRFPALIQLAKQMGIAMEINPLSNQILGYIGDLRNHPAVYYMKQGVPITISPDDPGVFGYRGVTPDYWAIYMAWGLDLQALKQLVFNSIQYSALPQPAKQQQLALLQQRWEKWVNWAMAN